MSGKHRVKHVLFLAFGAAVSVVTLWFVLRNQSFSELAAELRRVNWGWVALSTAVFYLSFWLRAVRWALFFPPEARLTGRRIFAPMMVGYALNSLFPARLGELARAALVGHREKTSIPTSLATVVAERVVDSVTILSAMALVFLFVPFGDFSMTWGRTVIDAPALKEYVRKFSLFFVLPLLVCVILIMIPSVERLAIRIVNAMTFLPDALRGIGVHLIRSFAQGFESLKSPGRIALIVVYSVAIWGLTGWSVALIGPAFGVPVSPMQGLALVVICCVAILIPAAPGYWGLFEIGFVFGGHILGLVQLSSEATVTAMALLTHLIQYVPIIILGFLGAGAMGISMTEAAHQAKEADEAKE